MTLEKKQLLPIKHSALWFDSLVVNICQTVPLPGSLEQAKLTQLDYKLLRVYLYTLFVGWLSHDNQSSAQCFLYISFLKKSVPVPVLLCQLRRPPCSCHKMAFFFVVITFFYFLPPSVLLANANATTLFSATQRSGVGLQPKSYLGLDSVKEPFQIKTTSKTQTFCCNDKVSALKGHVSVIWFCK